MRKGMTSMLRGALCGFTGLTVLAAGGAALAQAPKEPIKIGLINALTGPLAVTGSEINEGIKLYWEDEMGIQVAGRSVMLLIAVD